MNSLINDVDSFLTIIVNDLNKKWDIIKLVIKNSDHKKIYSIYEKCKFNYDSNTNRLFLEIPKKYFLYENLYSIHGELFPPTYDDNTNIIEDFFDITIDDFIIEVNEKNEKEIYFTDYEVGEFVYDKFYIFI